MCVIVEESTFNRICICLDATVKVYGIKLMIYEIFLGIISTEIILKIEDSL